MRWIEDRCNDLEPDGSLQIMYGIDGHKDLTEEILPNLEGYAGSSPVRIGNGAYDQLQLDIYGELMDSVYLYNKYGAPISHDLWDNLVRLVDWVTDHWQLPDEGVWEVRGGRQEFLYSRLMCWVAVDRAIRLADRRSFPYPVRAVARDPRRDLRGHLHELLGSGTAGIRPAQGVEDARRVDAAHADDEVHRLDRPPLALDPPGDRGEPGRGLARVPVPHR